MKIYDSVLGFIHLNTIEAMVAATLPFRRLHGIHQLGGAFFVYPGASHKRYEHSLGTMLIATQIFEEAIEKADLKKFDLPYSLEYSKQIVRLGALLHDVGHLPLSHVCENELLGDGGHEKWTAKILSSAYFDDIWSELSVQFPKNNIRDDVIRIAIGEKKCKKLGLSGAFLPWESVLSSIVTGDLFGADRMDYLLRDAHFSGLKYGVFDYKHLIGNLILTKDSEDKYILAIRENGIDACDSLLIARHFMFKRLYYYPTVKEYNFHLGKFAISYMNQHQITDSVENYFKVIDYDILSAVYHAYWKGNTEIFHAKALFDKESRFKAVPLISEDQVAIVKSWVGKKEALDVVLDEHKEHSNKTLMYPLRCYGGKVSYKNIAQYPVAGNKVFGWLYIPPTMRSELMRELC
jgi:uncharacterized protein